MPARSSAPLTKHNTSIFDLIDIRRCTVATPSDTPLTAKFRRGIVSTHGHGDVSLPVLLTVDEAAALLRTTRRAVYAMVARRQLPGVTRIRRRVLLRAEDLLHWLDQKRAPLPKE
jgi:excisionase family DNA binding protein